MGAKNGVDIYVRPHVRLACGPGYTQHTPLRPSTPTRRTVLPIGMRSLPELIARVFVCTFVAVFLLHAALQLFQQGVAQARARGAVRDP